MNDDEYVAEFRAMLTNLNPIGAGSGARVTSVRLVREHRYDEMEIQFDAVIDCVDHGPGSLRVDLDREWRELSGYAEPGAYVSKVVEELDRAVRHVVAPPWSRAMDPDDAWADLLRNLGYQGTVHEAGDGRIHVTDGQGDGFTVLVTRQQWAAVWAHQGYDFFHDLLEPRAEDETFVVFHRGDLALSVREQLPPVASIALRLEAREMRRHYDEAIARDPNAQVGWFAYPPRRASD